MIRNTTIHRLIPVTIALSLSALYGCASTEQYGSDRLAYNHANMARQPATARDPFQAAENQAPANPTPGNQTPVSQAPGNQGTAASGQASNNDSVPWPDPVDTAARGYDPNAGQLPPNGTMPPGGQMASAPQGYPQSPPPTGMPGAGGMTAPNYPPASQPSPNMASVPPNASPVPPNQYPQGGTEYQAAYYEAPDSTPVPNQGGYPPMQNDALAGAPPVQQSQQAPMQQAPMAQAPIQQMQYSDAIANDNPFADVEGTTVAPANAAPAAMPGSDQSSFPAPSEFGTQAAITEPTAEPVPFQWGAPTDDISDDFLPPIQQ